MPVSLLIALVVLLGFLAWGALLFWGGERVAKQPPRHETRRERRRLHHKG